MADEITINGGAEIRLLRPQDIELAVTRPLNEGPLAGSVVSMRLTDRPGEVLHLSTEALRWCVAWFVRHADQVLPEMKEGA